MQPPAIIQAVDAIETKDFLAPTMIASGHETVADILAESPEFSVLLKDVPASSLLLRDRYRERESELADGARLAYFVFFGLARDQGASPLIRSYLAASRTLPRGTLLSPWHPFLHGVTALEKITGIPAPTGLLAPGDLDEFLRRVERWEEGSH